MSSLLELRSFLSILLAYWKACCHWYVIYNSVKRTKNLIMIFDVQVLLYCVMLRNRKTAEKKWSNYVQDFILIKSNPDRPVQIIRKHCSLIHSHYVLMSCLLATTLLAYIAHFVPGYLAYHLDPVWSTMALFIWSVVNAWCLQCVYGGLDWYRRSENHSSWPAI
jgi:hypothetical protein